MLKNVLSVASTIIFSILIVLVGFSVYLTISAKVNPNVIPSIFGYKPLTVLSNSMYPYFQAGDMVFSKQVDPSAIKKGDVITFKSSEGRIVTHRVANVTSKNGELYFQTKGDNNNVADEQLAPADQILGRMSFMIPKAGVVAKFAASPLGAIVFFGIPALLYVLLEVLERLKKRKQNDAQLA